jgi:hypothetical protein
VGAPVIVLTFTSVVCALVSQARAQEQAARLPVPGAPSGATAFVDVGVVPMDGERVLAGQTVLVKDGWITALGPTNQVVIPAEGTVAVGKRADLVLLTGNPLTDIQHTMHPSGVMLGGRWLSQTAIDRRLAQSLAHP